MSSHSNSVKAAKEILPSSLFLVQFAAHWANVGVTPTILVDQLYGEFDLKKNNGTEFDIRFTVRENNDQVLSPKQLKLVDNE